MSKELEISREQLIPVALLYASGCHIKGKTRLQKLAFLLDKEELGDNFEPYNFKRSDYGPFSMHLHQDTERLNREGVIGINKTRTSSGNAGNDYELEEDWIEAVEELAEKDGTSEIFQAAEQLVEKHGDKSIRDLIEYIYEGYSMYEENSVLY